MTLRRHLTWYIATIGGLSAVSQDRLEAKRLVLAMYAAATPGGRVL
mgnify:CR=1 FL=1